jgi:membrane-bound lytic murein transglycosylase
LVEVKQMIASLVQQLGWTKPPAGPESVAVRLSAPKTPQAATAAQAIPEIAASTSKAPIAPSLEQQVKQIEADIAAAQQTLEQRLAALHQTVEQLAVGQDQVLREIAKLQAPTAPTGKPRPVPPPTSSRAPTTAPHP